MLEGVSSGGFYYCGDGLWFWWAGGCLCLHRPHIEPFGHSVLLPNPKLLHPNTHLHDACFHHNVHFTGAFDNLAVDKTRPNKITWWMWMFLVCFEHIFPVSAFCRYGGICGHRAGRSPCDVLSAQWHRQGWYTGGKRAVWADNLVFSVACGCRTHRLTVQ